ncbi:hypothetical protein NIES21_48040 [Anabaenopsis circularis NIES-21]|uniref:Uncharacterized protein n=2 Tax=Nostocales TaxID=1161 RepID=A0A1Z4GNP2_9CYAN|nr:hypothetical protein [Nostoc cycadae]BAY18946.1 hypothetical protein NIES21_48040 [Anabaenopsis circularis NIES-21]GBE92938.1 hypothetical protein NCWK1_2698 [Nostoc cycadae WK-1]
MKSKVEKSETYTLQVGVIQSPSVAQALRVVTVAIDISPGFNKPNQPKLHYTLNGYYLQLSCFWMCHNCSKLFIAIAANDILRYQAMPAATSRTNADAGIAANIPEKLLNLLVINAVKSIFMTKIEFIRLALFSVTFLISFKVPDVLRVFLPRLLE